MAKKRKIIQKPLSSSVRMSTFWAVIVPFLQYVLPVCSKGSVSINSTSTSNRPLNFTFKESSYDGRYLDRSGWSQSQQYYPPSEFSIEGNSFFDLTLSGLAILSFGIFILNIFLNAFLFKGSTTSLDTDLSDMGDYDDEFSRRNTKKRSFEIEMTKKFTNILRNIEELKI